MKRIRQNKPLEKVSKNISLTYYMNIFKQVQKKMGENYILKLINNSSSYKPIRIGQFGQVRVV